MQIPEHTSCSEVVAHTKQTLCFLIFFCSLGFYFFFEREKKHGACRKEGRICEELVEDKEYYQNMLYEKLKSIN